MSRTPCIVHQIYTADLEAMTIHEFGLKKHDERESICLRSCLYGNRWLEAR
jgi:hypothetical protein